MLKRRSWPINRVRKSDGKIANLDLNTYREHSKTPLTCLQRLRVLSYYKRGSENMRAKFWKAEGKRFRRGSKIIISSLCRRDKRAAIHIVSLASRGNLSLLLSNGV